MGEMIEFPCNGRTVSGYLASPPEGAGPGLVVVQEWWGLVPQIKGVCERLAGEGFTALAPDLYGGEIAMHSEPDKAGELMMAMEMPAAARDMACAVDLLDGHEAVRGDGVGVVGFCMGGGLALILACQRPDKVRAVVPYYGIIPWPGAQPDWSQLAGAVQGHYGEDDDMTSPAVVRALEQELKDLGKEAEFFMYPKAGHAFANEQRPDVYNEDAARQAWIRTLEFLRAKLG